jgi:hypothetical protein
MIVKLTAKRWQRTAQGFSPGKRPTCCRPVRATDERVPRRDAVNSGNDNSDDLTRPHSVALTGRTVWARHPGRKPWAILSDHFMVKKINEGQLTMGMDRKLQAANSKQ